VTEQAPFSRDDAFAFIDRSCPACATAMQPMELPSESVVLSCPTCSIVAI
jgi:hypothetical protein